MLGASLDPLFDSEKEKNVNQYEMQMLKKQQCSCERRTLDRPKIFKIVPKPSRSQRNHRQTTQFFFCGSKTSGKTKR